MNKKTSISDLLQSWWYHRMKCPSLAQIHCPFKMFILFIFCNTNAIGLWYCSCFSLRAWFKTWRECESEVVCIVLNVKEMTTVCVLSPPIEEILAYTDIFILVMLVYFYDHWMKSMLPRSFVLWLRFTLSKVFLHYLICSVHGIDVPTSICCGRTYQTTFLEDSYQIVHT